MKKSKVLLFNLFIVIIWFQSPSFAQMRDPTKPVHYTGQGVGNQDEAFNLQSIFIGPMRYLAMINGQMVGVGSSIAGARVLAIGKNHVVLLQSGQKKIIYLFGRRMWTAH